MPILLKRKNGEITPFRNAEYISAFYFIPKSILDKCGEEINSIPRNPRKLLQDRRAIEIIESDLFKLVIIDAYAFMVWPFMGLGAKREIYSGYEPSWRYAHAASIWIKGMEDEGVIPKSQEILKSSNVYEDIGYISEEEISETFTWLVPKIMAKHNMNEIIAVAAEYRCFEDFDYRKSRQKIDFYRKWYHTRAKISVESLDEIKEKYAENLQNLSGSKNKAIISAINGYFEQDNNLAEIVRETIAECLRNISVVQAQAEPITEILSEEENELMDSLDMFLGE